MVVSLTYQTAKANHSPLNFFKMNYLLNSFSLNMIDKSIIHKVRIEPTTPELIKAYYCIGDPVNSYVGHEQTAIIFEKELNKEKGGAYMPIKFNRQTVRLTTDDIAFVGQYIGERLPESATELPEGATIEWFKVYFNRQSQNIKIITGAVDSFDFKAAYAEAEGKLDGEEIVSVSFVDRGANGMGEHLVCAILCK